MHLEGKSIRSKLIARVTMISLTWVCITFASFFIFEILSYRQSVTRQVQVSGEILAANSTASLAFKDEDDSHEILSAVRSEKFFQSVALFDEHGKLFTSYTADSSNKVPVSPGNDGVEIYEGYVEGFIPVMHNHDRLGTLYLRRSTDDMNSMLLMYSFIAVIVIIVCLIATYVISRQLQKMISDPIIGLSDTALQVSARKDYGLRANGNYEGEIGYLIKAFNNMLGTIETQNIKIQRHTQELEEKIQERTADYKRQKDFAETVVDSSLVLIAVFDLETRFIAFNKKCEEEFQLKRSNVLGRKYDDVMPQVVASQAYESVMNAIQGKVTHTKYRSAVNNQYYESYVTPLVNSNGDVYAVLMTAHNITNIVQTTEALQQTNIELGRANQELGRKNSELEQFAYVSSHDLQEPLRKIQIFSQLAITNMQNPESLVKHLAKIEASAGRMTTLIKAVLDYARLTHTEESHTPVVLSQLIDDIRNDFELIIEEKNAMLRAEELPVISGHKLQLHQLFANLISNALKFASTNPVVSIRTGPIVPSDIERLDKSRQYVKIEVEDNGIGFDEKFKEKIFTIFQRLHSREEFEGTGIGLALCKKIAENHHGEISVRSAPGVGTTFTVILSR